MYNSTTIKLGYALPGRYSFVREMRPRHMSDSKLS